MFSIGVDSGTQSTKVLIVDFESGRIVGRGQAPHAMIPGLKPGESEQDPDVWIWAFEEALKEAEATLARVSREREAVRERIDKILNRLKIIDTGESA